MKVVLVVNNVVQREETCNDDLECLEIYSDWIIQYEEELGYCYGVNIEGKTKCSHGYIQWVKKGFLL